MDIVEPEDLNDLVQRLLAFDEALALEISGLARSLAEADATENPLLSAKRLRLADAILERSGWRRYI